MLQNMVACVNNDGAGVVRPHRQVTYDVTPLFMQHMEVQTKALCKYCTGYTTSFFMIYFRGYAIMFYRIYIRKNFCG